MTVKVTTITTRPSTSVLWYKDSAKIDFKSTNFFKKFVQPGFVTDMKQAESEDGLTLNGTFYITNDDVWKLLMSDPHAKEERLLVDEYNSTNGITMSVSFERVD